jgi:chromate reductase, NAD(P)H dehydrogenase (quinone)
MISIISGTNRTNNQTLRVAKAYQALMAAQEVTAGIINLQDFTSIAKDSWLTNIEENIIYPTTKFVIVSPEYNGSFPGILKLMIDMCPPAKAWHSKKVMLVGVAEGRAGNIRGMDHLTNICHHLKMDVMHNKLPLSKISTELDEAGNFCIADTLKAVQHQIHQFIKF